MMSGRSSLSIFEMWSFSDNLRFLAAPRKLQLVEQGEFADARDRLVEVAVLGA